MKSAILTKHVSRLISASTLKEIADLRNKFCAVQDYARQSRMGLEQVNEIAEAPAWKQNVRVAPFYGQLSETRAEDPKTHLMIR